jgi:membrane protein involved in colicin uptake
MFTSSEASSGMPSRMGRQSASSEASEHEFGFPPDDTISTLPPDEPNQSDSDHILSLERQVRELRLSSAQQAQSIQTSLESILSLTRQAELKEQARAASEAARITAEARASQAEIARRSAEDDKAATERKAAIDLAAATSEARAQAELVRAAAETAREVAVRTAVTAAEAPLKSQLATLQAELAARPALVPQPPQPTLHRGQPGAKYIAA